MEGRKQNCLGSWKGAGVQKIGKGGVNSFHILPRRLSKVLQVSQGETEGYAGMNSDAQESPEVTTPLKLLLPGKTSPAEAL